MNHWSKDAIFYHIYPLGFCGAPPTNDFSAGVERRLDAIRPWVEHICNLGCNAIYLGPLFESTTHGYDTRDYYHVDRRLGDDETLVHLVRFLHQHGLRVILDGVFNHTGRDFWAFKDVQQYGQASAYCDWFSGLRFDQTNRFGEPFTYDTWAGYDTLVKLNLKNPATRSHLFGAVSDWVERYEIDGLRLDAADNLDFEFLEALSAHCKSLKDDFWLVGEVVHGDYNRWANQHRLSSVTNYECYKGLYSSLNDRNYFEIAYALNRQFGDKGLYRDLPLYTFADNHDVNRVASSLKNSAHLFPLYALLFSMPGVPSLYYGSEFGLRGEKSNGSDAPLRPALNLSRLQNQPPQPGLAQAIQRFAAIRNSSPALKYGDYRQVYVSAEQLAFTRQAESETALIVFNAAGAPATLDLNLPQENNRSWEDVLNHENIASAAGHKIHLGIPAHWARILIARN